MKTMKYRSVFSTLCVAALSVFLFTACEKESDEYGNATNNKDRLEKFKRLQFTGSGAETSTSSTGSSGTFTGTGSSNISFTPPPGDGNEFAMSAASSNEFAENESEGGRMFTDPRSLDPFFVVNSIFGTGGGSFTFDGETYDLDFGLCVSSNFFGFGLAPGDTSNQELNVFIGVDGNFDEYDSENQTVPFQHLVYLFSYNGGSTVGSLEDFENGNVGNKAFGMIISFQDGEEGNTFFMKSGSISFTETNVKVTNASFGFYDGMELLDNISFSADFDCVNFEE